jgi:predicted dehydrogenase
MVSQNYRYYPAPQAAAHFVREGHFGHLTSVKIDFRRHAPMEGYSYWDLPNPLLVDMAVHHYDLMRMVIGQDPAELSCRTWNPPGSPFKMAPCGAIVLSYPSDVVVSYRGSWLDQGPQTAWAGEWQMDFEQGSVLWTSRGDRPNPTRRDRMRIRRLNAEMEEVDLAPLPMHDRAGALAAFAAAVRTGSEPAFFPSGRANLATLAIVEATLKSSVAGGASVRLDSFYPDNGRSLK